MTRRSEWPLAPPPQPWPPEEGAAPGEPYGGGSQDSGGPVPSRAGAGPPRTADGARRRSRAGGEEQRRRQGGGTAEPSGESSDPAERARALCLRLLTGTPRTRSQLAEALRKKEIPEEVAGEVLDRFEEVGLVDDSAFATAWVESRHHSRGLARRALARELRTKGVESEAIDEALEQLDTGQEEERARALVARKLRSTAGLEREKRVRRLAGMLARKGYSEGLSLRVVREALEAEGEETGEWELSES
ncbi:recombination regulator RecX [Streptomyces xiaopingdaonensis]|uniref:recombination regulator RecX n=1 Tax=Streptomyces xiaopingdaonensis TaxID=1565415 RepID=UPI0002EC81C0|nr:recombination regulator RecX [Streptomyces xiaopingdaonensis]